MTLELEIETEDHMFPLSSNGFSVDLQVEDALSYLEYQVPSAYKKIKKAFPEVSNLIFEGSWLDTEAMGVDLEWSSWLIDALENTGLVIWYEGEPWGFCEEEA